MFIVGLNSPACTGPWRVLCYCRHHLFLRGVRRGFFRAQVVGQVTKKQNPLILLTYVLWALVTTATTFQSWAAPSGPFWQNSLEEIRWEGIARQTTTLNCGPAALATAFRAGFGDIVHPEDLFDAHQATSLTILRDIALARGYIAVGMRMTLDDLQRYLNDQQQPLLVRILAPTPHFTTVTGVVPGRVLTRDPALGRISWENPDWLRIWGGLALVIQRPHSPPAGLPDTAECLDILTLLMRPKDWRW